VKGREGKGREPFAMIEIMDDLWKVATPVTSLIVKHL
jgi:hypothetical protein